MGEKAHLLIVALSVMPCVWAKTMVAAAYAQAKALHVPLAFAALLLISVNGFGYEWLWGNSPLLANVTKVVWSYGLVGFLIVFVYRLLYEVLKKIIH